jgi:hypothetical protein
LYYHKKVELFPHFFFSSPRFSVAGAFRRLFWQLYWRGFLGGSGFITNFDNHSLRNAGSPQSPGRARGLGAILGYREITIFGGELAAWARQGWSRKRKEGGPRASPAGAGGARQNNSWQPSTSRARQGEHGAKTWAISQAQARAVHRKPQHGRPSAQAGPTQRSTQTTPSRNLQGSSLPPPAVCCLRSLRPGPSRH